MCARALRIISSTPHLSVNLRPTHNSRRKRIRRGFRYKLFNLKLDRVATRGICPFCLLCLVSFLLQHVTQHQASGFSCPLHAISIALLSPLKPLPINVWKSYVAESRLFRIEEIDDQRTHGESTATEAKSWM